MTTYSFKVEFPLLCRAGNTIMGNFLTASDAQLLQKWFQSRTVKDLALLLECKEKSLLYYLSSAGNNRSYRTWKLPKKGGGFREIDSPKPGLKILQEKIAHILTLFYQPKSATVGFVKGRSIVDGAKQHAGKKFVLNLDILNFFHSINFGRVRGALIASPYALDPSVATLIARLVCFNNRLPQGAPSSPILANIVSRPLDTALQRFATSKTCRYSRYADDITFSSNRSSIATFVTRGEDVEKNSHLFISGELLSIVKHHGFAINQEKTRLQLRNERQSVTGLSVNQFPNVSREYIKFTSLLLKSWKRFGLKNSVAYLNKNHGHSFANEDHLRSYILGRISFIKQVKGDDDQVYQNIVSQLISAFPFAYRKFKIFNPKFSDLDSPKNRNQKIEQLLWVVENNETFHQGTGFSLKGVGIVTANHVVEGANEDKIEIYKHGSKGSSPRIVSIKRFPKYDVAVLYTDSHANYRHVGFEIEREKDVHGGDIVIAAGFPDYSERNSVSVEEGRVLMNQVKIFDAEAFTIGQILYSGISGAPILNSKFQVVGLAVRGSDIGEEPSQGRPQGVVKLPRYLPSLLEVDQQHNFGNFIAP